MQGRIVNEDNVWLHDGKRAQIEDCMHVIC